MTAPENHDAPYILREAAHIVWTLYSVEGVPMRIGTQRAITALREELSGPDGPALRHAIQTMPVRLIIPPDVHFAPRDEPDWLLHEADRLSPRGRVGTWARHAWWRLFGTLLV